MLFPVSHILNHQKFGLLSFVQFQKFSCLYMISCNKFCGSSFVFNIMWYGFVLTLLVGSSLVLCCSWIQFCLTHRFKLICVLYGVVWHVGCVFICGVAIGRSCNQEVLIGLLFELKKSLGDFCDFVFIFTITKCGHNSLILV